MIPFLCVKNSNELPDSVGVNLDKTKCITYYDAVRGYTRGSASSPRPFSLRDQHTGQGSGVSAQMWGFFVQGDPDKRPWQFYDPRSQGR